MTSQNYKKMIFVERLNQDNIFQKYFHSRSWQPPWIISLYIYRGIEPWWMPPQRTCPDRAGNLSTSMFIKFNYTNIVGVLHNYGCFQINKNLHHSYS